MKRMRLLSVFLLSTACAAPAGGTAVGIAGAPLAGTLNVHVVVEAGLGELGTSPIAGASVDVGGAAVTTDANGDATIATDASSVTLTVRQGGFVTERWIGVDHDHAVVAMARPIPTRTITAVISGGSTDLTISAGTALPMLRARSTTMSTAPCAGGACTASLGIDIPSQFVDVVALDAHTARMASGVSVDTGIPLALDVSRLPAIALTSFEVTFPSSAGFAAVVGVPGVSAPNGVALLTSQVSSGTAMIPTHDGPFADDTFWFIVRATTADGHGESTVFDRSVGQTPGRVVLPSALLPVPTATTNADTVSITIDPSAALYVVESHGSAPMRALVLHPSGSQIDVALDGAGPGATVRAVDAVATSGDGLIDLGLAERTATRIATLTL